MISAKTHDPVQPTRTFSQAELQAVVSQYGAAGFVRNGIKTYSLSYPTKTWDGAAVMASASLVIPDVAGTYAIVNHNHGTLFPGQHDETPSLNRSLNADMLISYAMAAAGNIVVIPDYIGYGKTANLEHNYCDYHNIATNARDAVVAAQAYLEQEEQPLNGKLFITGYSEGGAVAVATQKKIEEQPIPGLRLSGTAALAGAYASFTMASKILVANEALPYMNTYAWVLKTYNKTGGIDRPMSYYIREPHASAFQRSVTAAIPLNPQSLFTPAFVQSFADGADPILAVFRKNDLTTFTPETPLILCHGDQDDYVPYYNAQIAYTEMKSRKGQVKLVTYAGKGHGNVMWDYLATLAEEFGKVK